MRISDWSSDVCSSDLQRSEPFGKLPARAADPDRIGRDSPGQGSGRQRPDPSAMDVAQHLGPLGLAQEGDHRDDDQQGFESLAQQDGEGAQRSEEHTSELQSLMRISYAVFCFKKKKKNTDKTDINSQN